MLGVFDFVFVWFGCVTGLGDCYVSSFHTFGCLMTENYERKWEEIEN